MERKIQLIMALQEAESSIKMYTELLHSAEKTMKEIRSELNDSFTPGNSRYSHGELASVKRQILDVLSNANVWVTPRILVESIPEHCEELIMRELHKLADDRRSNVIWNGRRGIASQYRKFGPL